MAKSKIKSDAFILPPPPDYGEDDDFEDELPLSPGHSARVRVEGSETFAQRTPYTRSLGGREESPFSTFGPPQTQKPPSLPRLSSTPSFRSMRNMDYGRYSDSSATKSGLFGVGLFIAFAFIGYGLVSAMGFPIPGWVLPIMLVVMTLMLLVTLFVVVTGKPSHSRGRRLGSDRRDRDREDWWR